jgi:hypothetical protein
MRLWDLEFRPGTTKAEIFAKKKKEMNAKSET